MSAKSATTHSHLPPRRPKRKANVIHMAGAFAAAMGVTVLLSGGSPSDVTRLSDALGTPVETIRLPAFG